jgi:hypothetical protein
MVRLIFKNNTSLLCVLRDSADLVGRLRGGCHYDKSVRSNNRGIETQIPKATKERHLKHYLSKATLVTSGRIPGTLNATMTIAGPRRNGRSALGEIRGGAHLPSNERRCTRRIGQDPREDSVGTNAFDHAVMHPTGRSSPEGRFRGRMHLTLGHAPSGTSAS